MRVFNWDDVEAEQITDLITRRYVSGEHMTIARFSLKKGCKVAAHSHPNEQLSTVLTGVLQFTIDGKDVAVKAGETLLIPPFTAHSADALEDCDILDVFSPIRADWIEGRDNYLRGETES